MKRKFIKYLRKELICTLILLIFVFFESEVLCRDWHVLPERFPVPIIHNGSMSNPWNGFKDIIWGRDGVKGGDSLLLYGKYGPYRQCLNIGSNGYNGFPIVIKPAESENPILEVTEDITGTFKMSKKYKGCYVSKTSSWPNRYYFFENGKPLKWADNIKKMPPGSWHLINYGHYYYRPTEGTIDNKTISVPYQVSYSSSSKEDEFGIDISGRHYIIVEGLEIKCCYGAGIMLRDGSSNIIIRKNRLKYNAIQGVALSNDYPNPKFIGCRNVRIYDNVFETNGNGVYIRDGNAKGPEIKAREIEIFSNEYMNNSPDFSYQKTSDCHAIGTMSADNCYIHDNIIHDCVSYGGASTAGIYLWAREGFSSIGNKIFRNDIFNVVDCCMGQGSIPKENVFDSNSCKNADIGMVVFGRCKIKNNYFKKIKQIGIYIKNEKAKPIFIKGNTIIMEGGKNYFVHYKNFTKEAYFGGNKYENNDKNESQFYIGNRSWIKFPEILFNTVPEKIAFPPMLQIQ